MSDVEQAIWENAPGLSFSRNASEATLTALRRMGGARIREYRARDGLGGYSGQTEVIGGQVKVTAWWYDAPPVVGIGRDLMEATDLAEAKLAKQRGLESVAEYLKAERSSVRPLQPSQGGASGVDFSDDLLPWIEEAFMALPHEPRAVPDRERAKGIDFMLLRADWQTEDRITERALKPMAHLLADFWPKGVPFAVSVCVKDRRPDVVYLTLDVREAA